VSRRRIALLLACGLLALMTAPIAAAAPPAKPKIRTSLTAIWQDVICVACHEPLALAQSPEATDEKEFIQRLVVQGDTKAQILRALVQQYGPAVLGKPPATGFNLTVYVLPPAVLVLGLGFIAFSLPRWRARARRLRAAEAAAGGSAGPDLPRDEAERLDRELAHFD
jgi:cytochrome c-type biogenesis protein CcmH